MTRSIKIQLHWQILIAIVIAVAAGVLLPQWMKYIDWMGVVFLRALKMVTIPLVFASIYNGVIGMGKAANLGRVAGKTSLYYLVTTVIAIIIGLVLVSLIKPGMGAVVSLPQVDASQFTGDKINLANQLTSIIPDNIFKELTNGNFLSIIVFAILFGFFTLQTDQKFQQPLKDIFASVYEVIMKMTLFILRFTPFGVFAIVSNMIANELSAGGNLSELAQSLGLFILTVWAGLLIQGLIILPLSVKLLAKENPLKHIRKVSVPLLTAFTTSSSAAALPLSIRETQDKCGVSSSLAGFTLPLGCTINMNGTALFECVAAIFIANVYGTELSFAQEIVIVLTSVLAAVGSAGIPMAGLVMMAVILSAVGLPLEGVGLVLAVNQFLEMPRTCLNVYGDLCGAVIVAKSEGEKLTIS